MLSIVLLHTAGYKHVLRIILMMTPTHNKAMSKHRQICMQYTQKYEHLLFNLLISPLVLGTGVYTDWCRISYGHTLVMRIACYFDDLHVVCWIIILIAGYQDSYFVKFENVCINW